MRTERIYTKAIAISKEDKEFIKKEKDKLRKQTEAGTLAYIIEQYKHETRTP